MTDSKVVTNVVDIQTGENKVAVAKQKTKSSRKGWAVLTKEEAERPGAALLKLIYEEGFKRGLKISEIAIQIGITPGHLYQLRYGIRPIPNISDALLQRMAAFLQVPRFALLLAAEKMTLADFYEPTTLVHQIEVALKAMEMDTQWAGIIPASITEADSKLKLLIIRLYEKASGKVLIPFQIFPEDI